MHLASMVASRFSVVTTLGRTMGQAWHLAEIYGMERFCAKVRACELPVLELEVPGSDARERIVEECRRALAEDGCDAIVLGCAGMADLCEHIGGVLGVPVIDGVAAATTLVESLVTLRLSTSKHGELARPLPKAMAGALAGFTLDARGLTRRGSEATRAPPAATIIAPCPAPVPPPSLQPQPPPPPMRRPPPAASVRRLPPHRRPMGRRRWPRHRSKASPAT